VYKKITIKNIDIILEYLPYFKNTKNSFYKVDKKLSLDPFTYSVRVYSFIKDLYENNFIIRFNHSCWQEEALKYFNDPKLLDSANLLILRKLLTLHVRKDRFCAGHFAHMIDTGHILNILKRLKIIRDNNDGVS